MKVLGLAGKSRSGKDTIGTELVRQHQFIIVAFADELKRIGRDVFLLSNDVVFGEPALRDAIEPRATDIDYWDAVWHRAVSRDIRLRITRLFEDAPTPISSTTIFEAFTDFVHLCEAQGAKFSARFMLQRLGTEFGRKLWPKVWVNHLRNTIEFIKNGAGYTRENGLFTPPHTDTEVRGISISDARFPNEAEEVHSWHGKMLWVDASKRVAPNAAIAHASEPSRRDFVVAVAGGDETHDLIDYDLDNNGPLERLPIELDKALEALWS